MSKLGKINIDKCCVCVLGMHRSGTSTISRAINLLGYYLGEDDRVINACPENPRGFWELFDIVCVHQAIFYKLRLDWDTTQAIDLCKLRSSLILDEKTDLKNIIINSLMPHGRWMWKDPRTCLLMPLWLDIIKELNISLKCIFVVRNPLDVALSLEKRNGFTLEKGLKMWALYNHSALVNITGQMTSFISYERFLADWEGELIKTANSLDLDWSHYDSQLKAKMNEFISPELQHCRSPISDLVHIPVNVRILYEYLLERTSDVDPLCSIPENIKNMALNDCR